MKIYPKQLSQQLNKKLMPIYLVSGDEFLLVQESCDIIRQHATNTGYTQRKTFDIQPGCNWEELYSHTLNNSLFGDLTVIELHLQKKINANNAKLLQQYLANLPDNKIVLIIAGKIEVAQQKSAWFKTIDTKGMIIQVWPLPFSQLPSWLIERLRAVGLKTDQDGIQSLAEHTAGNLLAAKQEIEKLVLHYGNGKTLTPAEINAVIGDNSRFNTFNLLDIALSGTTTAIEKILMKLKDDGQEPVLILWTIVNELRILINISYSTQQGMTIDQAMLQNNVRQQRRPLIKSSLTRLTHKQLLNLLQSALKIDLMIKGMDKQHLLWHELANIYRAL